ncbi:tRNA uridine-5-carboxymethylaminomethyl(34) synthesis GTPase MnmE [Bacteroidia bacterium]|jgi:tRNA modification GTPase|nr:tRNA uridine-5-carboxymethylaminomethyl(34) synthesis GTPase MnmE [Bacteroidia bacterium]
MVQLKEGFVILSLHAQMYQLNDNIIALSTPSGVAALGIVRLSGQDVVTKTSALFSKDIEDALGYSLHYGYLEDGDGQTIDEVMVSVFRAPKSFTGEDLVEITCHGSPVVIKLILDVFTNMSNVRLAEPGEFSLRAFMNKKLDLVKAESIADLIHSETEAAHKLAVNQLRNGFSTRLVTLRKDLIDFAALFELELDFGEEDVEFAQRDKLLELCQELQKEIIRLVNSFKQGNAIKSGIQTVIAGKPNAGKSTLLNALLDDNRAIVSNIAGTTRDTLEEKLNIKGVQFNLIDTAGLRDSTEDEIEQIGISRAKAAIKKANLILYLVDSSDSKDEITKELSNIIASDPDVHVVFTKVDLVDQAKRKQLNQLSPAGICISADQGDISELIQFLEEQAVELNSYGNSSLVTNQRHLSALQSANHALVEVIDGLENQKYAEQVASDLKQVINDLGQITGGTISADDVLSSVFSNFCIGK